MQNWFKLLIIISLGKNLMAAQSVIWLKNHNRLDIDHFHLQHNSVQALFYSSKISIPLAEITRIWLDDEFVVFSKGGSRFVGSSTAKAPEKHQFLNLETEDGQIISFAKQDIQRILSLTKYQLEEKNKLKRKKHKSQKWIGNADLGILLQHGNTDDSQLKITLNSKKISDHDILNVNFFASQGEANGSENSNSAKILTRYDLKRISDRFLFFLSSFEYDKIKKIDQRVVLGLGYGRTLFDESQKRLQLSAGLTVDRENLENGSKTSILSALLTAEFKIPALKGNFIEGTINLYPDIKEISSNLKADSSLSYLTPINKRTNLKISLNNRYQQTVLDNVEKLDTILSTSLSYNF